MQNTPNCARCSGNRTVYYRHPFEGGYHIGVYCRTCKTHAETGRTWYHRNWFDDVEIALMPKLSELIEVDPRQGKLF
jgi:hypothetical protein